MEKADTVTYLGGTLTSDSSRNAEISARMSKALATCHKLKIFWRKTDADKSWKMLVYNAIIISQLTYGLNTLNITPGIKARLNAFHMRGLRYMLNIDHSYYSHISNDEVIERANKVLNKIDTSNITWQQFLIDKAARGEEVKKIKLVGDIILERQQTLLGHLIRRDRNEDLMRWVSIDNDLQRPQLYKKKTGRPRASWIEDNLYAVNRKLFNDVWDPNDQHKIDRLIQAANDRKF